MNYIEDIAREIERQIEPGMRPSNDAQALYRLYSLLVLATGTQTTLENVHDAWSVWMTTVDARHPALVPFNKLSAEKQEEDRPYRDAIRRVAESRLKQILVKKRG